MSPSGSGLVRLLRTLQELRIEYMVGGSVASSMLSIPRFTNDVDIVLAVSPEAAERLAAALVGEFYADPETARTAVQRGHAFNVIHLESGLKFDLFPLLGNAWSRAQFARRISRPYALPSGESIPLTIATVEDMILAKLSWYSQGGRVSDRQLRDVSNLIEVNKASLDASYLLNWARTLGLLDLLRPLLPPTVSDEQR